MAKEIERKFLVTGDSYKSLATSSHTIMQAYLSTTHDATVRLRVIDSRGFITVKGITNGCTRDEWEYGIPADDARAMAVLPGVKTLEKTRWLVPWEGFTWEVDEFHGRLEGLVIAEVEMPSEDCDPPLPPFVGAEVTGDPAYYNSNL